MSKGSVAVEIAGQQYRIRSDADEESLHRLAAYVDRAMLRVRQGTGTVDSLDVAVLTCLNLAREILALRDQRSAGVEEGKLRALIERVESVLGNVSLEARSPMAKVDEARDVESLQPAGTAASNEESARTLDLPSVEALRDRGSSSDEEVAASPNAMPEARVASGGRDRAS